MAQKKTTQKGTDLNENFHLKDKIALALSAMAVLLAGFQVYWAIKHEKQNIKQIRMGPKSNRRIIQT